MENLMGGSLDPLMNQRPLSLEDRIPLLDGFVCLILFPPFSFVYGQLICRYLRNDHHEELIDDFMESFTVNGIGVIRILHVFIPLLCRSHVKKIITISTDKADLELITNSEISYATPYTISKAALVAKYHTT